MCVEFKKFPKNTLFREFRNHLFRYLQIPIYFVNWKRVVYIKRAFKGWSVVRTNNSSGYLMETVNLNIDISGRKHLY